MADITSGEFRDFINTVRGEPDKGDCIVTGTVSRIDSNRSAWVLIGDNAEATPCSMDVSAHVGDTVTVRIADHKATITGNVTSPATDDRTANRARKEAKTANDTADEALDESKAARASAEIAKQAADAASADAEIARESAEEAATSAEAAETAATQAISDAAEAKQAADTAQSSADAAQASADSAGAAASAANVAARGAVAGLGQVQDVIGTLDWIREHGTYALTEDITVDPSKVYYIRSGTAPNYTYTPVAEPKDEELATYYELSVDEAVTEFIGAHLALLNDGLHIVSDASGYYIVLSNDAMRIYDPQNTLVATYGETVQIGRSDESHVEMDFNTFKMVTKEGSDFAEIGDMRDADGFATLTEYFEVQQEYRQETSPIITPGNISIPIEPHQYHVTFTIAAQTPVTLKVDGEDYTGAYAWTNDYVYFSAPPYPQAGAELAITYKTTDEVTAYTFGTRGDGGIGPFSFAEGEETVASGAMSHAEGGGTKALGVYAHAEGGKSKATGDFSHAEGTLTEARAYYAHAEGRGTTASGMASHAEGWGTAASSYSHAEGNNTTADGSYSHAEGDRTAARSGASHAEGTETQAIGHSAHAEGRSTITVNDYAHAEGYGTFASASAQHVEGRYNEKDLDSQYAHIIGNGTDDSNRSNAFTVDWSGNTSIAGKLMPTRTDRSTSYVAGGKGEKALVYAKKDYGEDYWYPAMTIQTKGGGSWQIGNYSNENLQFVYFDKSHLDAGENQAQLYLNITPSGINPSYLSGAVPINKGGTGATTASAAVQALTGRTWDFGTENTTDTWVPVATTVNNVATWRHRAIPTNLATTPTSLWSGNTNANITLSQTVANFKRVTIFYRDNDSLYSSVDVYDPLNKSVLLTSNYNGRYIKSRVVNLNGTAVNSWFYGQTDAVTGAQDSQNLIYITRVLGWKY